MSVRDDPTVDLQRWLRTHSDEDDELTLKRAEAKQLHDEKGF